MSVKARYKQVLYRRLYPTVKNTLKGQQGEQKQEGGNLLAKIAAFLLSSWLSFLLREKPQKVTDVGERELCRRMSERERARGSRS
jgi:hypothetical protein